LLLHDRQNSRRCVRCNKCGEMVLHCRLLRRHGAILTLSFAIILVLRGICSTGSGATKTIWRGTFNTLLSDHVDSKRNITTISSMHKPPASLLSGMSLSALTLYLRNQFGPTSPRENPVASVRQTLRCIVTIHACLLTHVYLR
jgi:hypothetical protein